ncbi:transmembrane protein C1orf162 homolog [Artibeus jamaicensis]|uniref:transmembrane protein C1orf162 homolog n=1 Tax=Artibeus jamaicensis TaxID=9417 RepID=UPI00235B1AF1|nr:transmembrane protein C1orf162 homolog [Artibeus jamaicensis]XP_037008442.2 transmembrane protein C1orf162 homolog [Artibeus jamaicensis]
MGGSSSQPECNTAQTTPTTAAPCTCDYPKKELQLVLAFLGGILLALLLMTIVLLIIKCYRKCHSSRQALDPHSDSLAEFPSTPDKALTSAGMDFKISEETTDQCRANYPANTDTVVYAQIV